jgi:hypothetical protein
MKAKLRPNKVVCECGRTMFGLGVSDLGEKETLTCLNERCEAYEKEFELPAYEMELVEVKGKVGQGVEGSVEFKQPVELSGPAPAPLEAPKSPEVAEDAKNELSE